MAIVSAEIEANGWVLKVVHDGNLSSPPDFTKYALTPRATPKLSVGIANRYGYTLSAGSVVAGSMAYTVVGTKPLRQAVTPNSAAPAAAPSHRLLIAFPPCDVIASPGPAAPRRRHSRP